MPTEYKQTVKINLEVEGENKLGQLATVADELESVRGKLEGLDDELSNVDNAISDLEQRDFDPDLEFGEEFDEDLQKLNQVTEQVQALDEAKDSLEGTQDELGDTTDNTAGATDREAKSFKKALNSGRGLADAKKAAAEANELLTKKDEEGTQAALEEVAAFNDGVESAEELREVLDGLSKKQSNLSDENERTADSLDLETRSVTNLAEKMDGDTGLAGAKRAVADANKKLSDRNEATSKTLQEEFDITEKEANKLLDLEDSNRRASRASRSLRNTLDETGDSMRAASKVSGVFKDGIGSLSVNLGAFTIALKNFLTQIPLLLAALGSLGSAVAGVASAFIAAGGAIGAAIGAGALANAQQLDEQYQSIEGTGEALQVMMRDMKDLFLEAAQPLLENEKVIDIFSQTVEGLANSLHLVALTFDELMTIDKKDLNVLGPLSEGSDEAKKDIMGISDLVDALGQRLSEPFRELNKAMSFAFLNLQDEFLDMSVGIIDALSDMIRFSTKFVDGVTEANRSVSVFSNTIAEMAKLGSTAFAGLLPVFTAFAGIVSEVAAVINSMNKEFVAAAITFVAIFAALSKVSGFLSGVVGVIPNFVVAVQSANGSVVSLTQTFINFLAESKVVGAGFVNLANSANMLGSQYNLLQLRTEDLEDELEDVDDSLISNTIHALESANSMEELKDEIIEVAVESELGEDELEDYGEELENIGLKATFTSSRLDRLAETQSKVDRRTAAFGAGAGGRGAGREAGAFGLGAGAAADGDRDKRDGPIKRLTGLFDEGIMAGLGQLVARLGSLTSKLSKLSGPLLVIVAVLGGLLVGLIGNLEEVTSLLAVVGQLISDIMRPIASATLEIFIAVWNALVDIMIAFGHIGRPIFELLQMLGIGADDASGGFSALGDVLGFFVEGLITAIDFIGAAARNLGMVLGIIVKLILFITPLTWIVFGLIEAFNQLNAAFVDMSDSSGPLGQALRSIKNIFQDIFDFIGRWPSFIRGKMAGTIEFFQDLLNSVIDLQNRIVELVEKAPGLETDLQKIDKIEAPTGQEGGGPFVDREELSKDSQGFIEGLTGKKDKKITYNEDNSTNIEQTVNADPEDQAQLSRVVTDAVAEANSFERRRQGGQ